MTSTDPSTTRGLAARIGGYCWIEQQLFGLFGGWVRSTADPESKLLVAAIGEHAGWRARRWFEALPTAPPGPDQLVLPPTGAEAIFVAAVRVGQDPDHQADRLVLAGAVLLPALVEAMEADLASIPALAAAPVRRLLEIGLFDIGRDREFLGRATSGTGSTGPEFEIISAAITANGGFFGPN